MKTGKNATRWSMYILGMVILSLGIILNTKSGLGVSPIISVPYTFSAIFSLNFGNASMVMYVVLAIVEYILKGKNFRAYDLLQIPLSFAVTRLFNVFGALLPDVNTLGGRFLVLAAGIVLTGIGAAMSLNARLVPNPGDGIVQAIADRAGKGTGICKNIFDLGCVAFSCVTGLLLSGHLAGIGIGTVCAMIGVGRVIFAYNHLIGFRSLEWMGLERSPAQR